MLNLEIKPTKPFQVKEVLIRNHYLHTAPKIAKYWLGVYNGTQIMKGAITISNPVARNEDQKYTVEITRFWLSDDLPKNSESFVMSKIFALLRQNKEIKRIIAYAEEGRHLGTIYKASGFKLIGKSHKHGKRTWATRKQRKEIPDTIKLKFEKLLVPSRFIHKFVGNQNTIKKRSE
jgi:hypothetical protein